MKSYVGIYDGENLWQSRATYGNQGQPMEAFLVLLLIIFNKTSLQLNFPYDLKMKSYMYVGIYDGENLWQSRATYGNQG